MFDISRSFEVTIQGGGTLRLGPGDYVASGGEGHVYRRKALAIKVWDDPDHAVRARMPEKVRLLAALRHPYLVLPEALALDARGRAVGYVMPWVADGTPLPRMFTNDWRAANGYDDAKALAFAGRMREAVAFAHGKGAVLGDGNELNVLAVGNEPRYIDTDPWALPGFPGDKVLPTVRDWHAAPFTREADWFAWGVVTFQLLVGVHPYRGTHPSFKRADLEGRMRANASVFDGRVRLSPAARPFSAVPGPLLDWYRAVFQDGFRGPPPDPSSVPAAAAPRRGPATPLAPGADLRVADLYALPAPVLRAAAPDVVLLDGGALVSLPDGRAYGKADPRASFARLPDGTLAGIRAEGRRLLFGTLRAAPGAVMAEQDTGIAAESAWSSENRLFAVVHDGLLELHVRDLGARTVAAPGRRWALNPDATAFGDGIAVYDALGARFLVAPFGPTGVAVLRARELDGLRMVASARRGRVAVLSLIDRQGAYLRAVVLFARDYSGHAVALSPADDGSLGDAVTETGVVVRLDANGKLELTVPETGAARLADPGPAGNGRLLTGPSGVFCAAGGRMLKLSTS